MVTDHRWRLAIWTTAEELGTDVIAFNSAIASCRAQWQMAWHLLAIQLSQGVKLEPNVRSYGAVASACMGMGQWARANFLLEDMAGRQVTPNLVSFNTIAGACRSAGRWPQVLEVLGSSGQQPDVISLTLAVAAAEQAASWGVALQVLDQAVGLQPDMMFYSTAMSACQGAGQWKGVLHLLASTRVRECLLSTVACNVAISSSEGSWQLPLELLEFMKFSVTKPDLYSFNSSIRACGKGSWRAANEVLRAAGRVGLTPDVVTFSSLADEQRVQLNAVIYNSSILTCPWPHALALLLKSQGQRLADTVTLNATVEACGKAMRWQQAVQVLRGAMAWRLEASDLTYGLTIAACQTATAWLLALGLLSEMVLWQFFLCLQRLLWNIAMKSDYFTHEKKVELTKSPAAEVTFQVQTSKLTYTEIIRRTSQWLQLLDLLETVRESWLQLCRLLPVSYLQVDEVMQNALLAALGSEWILAMDILQRFEGQKSIVSYNSVATACGQAMQWLEAVALLSLPSQVLQELDCYSYTAIISASATLAWRQAWYFFSLQDDMSSATIEAFNSALSCAKWQATLEVLGKIKGKCLVPTLVSFNATSSACSRAVAWSQAVGLLSAMTTLRLDATVPCCTAVATSCIRSQNFAPALLDNQLAAALNLLQQMYAKSVPLDSGSYNYLILALLRVGASEWAEHLVHRAMADKVFEKVRPQFLDLHGMSGPVARFCLLLTLCDEASHASSKPLKVVTGIGKHSDGAPIVKPEVLSLCQELRLPARLSQDGGSVQVSSKHLTSTLARQVRAAFQPHAVWSEDVPEALGPPSLSLAAAPFWALATASSQGRIRALLKPLVTPEAVDLSKAVPPWLPFVTFASLLAGHSKAWRDETCRELLERYVDRHLRSSPSWKDYLSQEWISELMRGLCDRLAKIFLEESFMDSLLASTLWSFSASFMPPACRAVCWGEDATLLRFLDRALLCESSTLLWQLEDYVALEGAASRLENTNARTWPRAIAARSASAGGLHTTPQEKLDLDSLE
eukprot:s1871_g5.t1